MQARRRRSWYNDRVTLRLCSDLSAADWLAGSDLRWDKLVTFGPSGFAAYARLLLLPQYPGQSENDAATDEALPAELEQLRGVQMSNQRKENRHDLMSGAM